jgi:hypothetical protein
LSNWRASQRDIGAVPEVVNPERRAQCERNLRAFLETYLAPTFFLAWSKDHLEVIEKLQVAVLSGGQFAVAMPRGSGKSSMVIAAAIWALIYGHRHFVVAVGASADMAAVMATAFQSELEANDLLNEDFPEICMPIRALDGIAQRAKSQLSQGERTAMQWRTARLVLPTIAGSKASGSLFVCKGITGSFRGLQHKTRDGATIRPDLVLVDDPQDDEIAASPLQVAKLERVLAGTVLGLGGPKSVIAAVATCTVIQGDDLADRLLNSERHPEWQGRRFAMIKSWPAEKDGLWREYERLYREGLREGNTGKARKYYHDHKAAMDAGAEMAWPERMLDGDESALQSAMNLRIERGTNAFQAEYQNDPQASHPGLYDLTAQVVASRVVGLPRLSLPAWAKFLILSGDLNHYGINWTAVAFDNHGTAHLVEYGQYPEGGELVSAATAETTTGAPQIATGVRKWAAAMLALPFMLGKKRVRPNALLLDGNYMTQTVFLVANALRAERYPLSVGRAKSARQYREPKGDRLIGRPQPWVASQKGQHGEEVVYCADYWRMIAQKAFLLDPGVPGACTLRAGTREETEPLANEICAEVLVAQAENLWDWRLKPGHRNDKLDALVGAYALAGLLGVTMSGGEQVWRRKKPTHTRETRKPKIPMQET